MYKKEKNKFYVYSHSSVPWQQQILYDFLQLVPEKKEIRCLDAGCGIGNNLMTLSKFFNDITACDILKDALDYAKNRFRNSSIKFTQANIEKLPFPENCFDLVVCTEVIEHIKNLDKAKKELMRVVKNDGGYLIISSPNYLNLAGVIKLIVDTLSKNKKWDVWGTNRNSNERLMTFFKLREFLPKNKTTILCERGGDFLNSWFLFLPFIFRNFKYTDKHPSLKLGQRKFFSKIAMNYFIFAKTKSHQ